MPTTVMGHAVDFDLFADDGLLTAEAAAPESVRDHRDGVGARSPVLVGQERPSRGRADAEKREVGRRHDLGDEPLRLRDAGEVEVEAGVSGHGLERTRMLAQTLELRRRPREGLGRPALLLVGDRHGHERVRLPVGERAQHRRVEDREDRRDRADPEPERQDRDGGEARVAEQPAKRVAGVLQESAHQLTR